MPVIMEGIWRAVFTFLVLLLLVRLLDKQSHSQLTFFDLVSGITMGGMGAIMAAGLTVNIWGATASLLTFVALLILNGFLALESRPLRKLGTGKENPEERKK